MSPITLLLADDHNLIRSGLCALLKLEPDFQIVGEAITGREAVNLAAKLSPDIVIMDLAMPLLNGVEATRQLLRARPETKVIVLSAYEDDIHLEAVLGAGASAYLLKHTAASEICRAVREVHKGNAYFSPTIATKLREKSLSQLENLNARGKSPHSHRAKPKSCNSLPRAFPTNKLRVKLASVSRPSRNIANLSWGN